MTREERAAKRAQHLKDQLDATKRELAQVEAENRAAERAKRLRRYQRVGALADAAGLLLWENTTLAGLFQILAQLLDTPAPVAVLEGLLASPGSLDDGSADGMAHAAHGAAPDGAVGDVAR